VQFADRTSPLFVHKQYLLTVKVIFIDNLLQPVLDTHKTLVEMVFQGRPQRDQVLFVFEKFLAKCHIQVVVCVCVRHPILFSPFGQLFQVPLKVLQQEVEEGLFVAAANVEPDSVGIRDRSPRLDTQVSHLNQKLEV
jgi:hypothetical protein